LVRATINSEKHIRQIGFNNASIGAVSSLTLVSAVKVPSADSEVREGAVVKAVFIELWLQGEGMATGTSIVILEKLVNDGDNPTTANMIALNSYTNKKNILFTHQGLSSDQNTNAVPVMRGWYKVPKGKQRFGLGDKLLLQIASQVDGVNFCGNAIYKEYY